MIASCYRPKRFNDCILRTGRIIREWPDDFRLGEKVGQWILIGPLSPKRWTLVSAWVIYDKAYYFPSLVTM